MGRLSTTRRAEDGVKERNDNVCRTTSPYILGSSQLEKELDPQFGLGEILGEPDVPRTPRELAAIGPSDGKKVFISGSLPETEGLIKAIKRELRGFTCVTSAEDLREEGEDKCSALDREIQYCSAVINVCKPGITTPQSSRELEVARRAFRNVVTVFDGVEGVTQRSDASVVFTDIESLPVAIMEG